MKNFTIMFTETELNMVLSALGQFTRFAPQFLASTQDSETTLKEVAS